MYIFYFFGIFLFLVYIDIEIHEIYVLFIYSVFHVEAYTGKLQNLNCTVLFLFNYTEKNLLVNFTFFIRKFIIFIVTLGHTQNVGF